MKKIIWYLKVIFKKRRCIRCGKLVFGEAESVNVYDKVVGRHLGVKCDIPCTLKKGTPEWIKKYWLSHALMVLHKPDYFSKSAYKGAVNEYCDLITEKDVLKRIIRTIKYLNKTYPNKYDI